MDINKELLKLLDDKRTGLKDSSDTNKTRYNILGLVEEALEKQNSKISKLLGDILNIDAYNVNSIAELINKDLIDKQEIIDIINSSEFKHLIN